nr:hypothetical protein Iba_chr12aCG13610 [Ipomoea batatas]
MWLPIVVVCLRWRPLHRWPLLPTWSKATSRCWLWRIITICWGRVLWTMRRIRSPLWGNRSTWAKVLLLTIPHRERR